MLEACAVALVGGLAAASDLRRGKVPNALTVPAAACGLALGAALGGVEGLKGSALGAALGFGLLLLPALAGWVGGGDCKLLAALGSFLGPQGVLWGFLYGAALGGAGALAVLVRGCGGPGGLWNMAQVAASGRVPALPGRGGSLPYAPFLAAGCLLAALVT